MEEEPPILERIAVPTLTYSRASLAQALAAVAEAGFRQVDIWHVPGLCEHLDLAGSPESLASQLAEQGLEAAALSLYTNPRDNLEAGIRLAGRLAIPRLILGPALDYHDREAFCRLLKALAPAAQDAGVTLAVENHLNTGLDTVERLEALLAAVAHPAVRLCLAPPHLVAAGGSLEHGLTRLAGVIDYIYLWDMKAEYRPDRDGVDYGPPQHQLPGGEGRIHFPRLLAQLRRQQYGGGLGLMCTSAARLHPGRVTEQLLTARRALLAAWNDAGPGV